jgi:hypothetical protein
MDFYVLRKGLQSEQGGGSGGGAASVGNGVGGNNGPHHDWYELRGGTYKFGYYDCDRIVQVTRACSKAWLAFDWLRAWFAARRVLLRGAAWSPQGAPTLSASSD